MQPVFSKFRIFLSHRMKVVLIVLTIAVAVSAKPVNRKWEEIRDLVHGMGGNVDDTVASVKKWDEISEFFMGINYLVAASFMGLYGIALEANPEVGQQMEVYLLGKEPEINAIHGKIDDAIDAQTLTYNQAVTYFTEFETVLNNVHEGGLNIASELPQDAQNQIKEILEIYNRRFKQHVDQILILLTPRY